MFKVILWDVDGTLLDFSKSEVYALRTCFSKFDLGDCADDRIARYAVINTRHWKRLEAGEITKEEVLLGRFKEFFDLEHIHMEDIAAFNSAYQICLGDRVFFNDDCYPIIKDLKGRVKQYAVTNGTYTAQMRKLEKSGLLSMFDDVFISEKVGFDKPNIGFFEYVWNKIGQYDKAEIIIIGDSLTSDMQGGNNAGIKCCWYNPDKKENTMSVKIDYEIDDLKKVKSLLN